MTARVIKFQHRRTFTSAEAVLDKVREGIFIDGRPYHVIAVATGVSTTTVQNIARGKTQWPRHTTLFPLIAALGMQLSVTLPEKKGRT